MKNYISQQLGNRIQKLRKIKGLSQESLAQRIGIATNALSSIERGNAFMTVQTLEKITNIFNITQGELFTFDDISKNEEIYTYLKQKLELIKEDNYRLNMLYKIIKAIV